MPPLGVAGGSAGSARASQGRLAVIVAHPDDETLGLGGRLAEMPALTLVHLTDGAPRDMQDACRAGYRTRRRYAQARALELERALSAAGARIERRIGLGCADQEAVFALVELARRLVPVLADVDRVYSHPYEGGHPDHDAAAFAVQLACAQLERTSGRAPARLEFPSYHARGDEVVFGAFWPDSRCPETTLELDAAQAARKRAACEKFVSQRSVIAQFPLCIERERFAPQYDFTAPPPPGAALYDRFGWPVRSALWRREAVRALTPLERRLTQPSIRPA